MQNGTFGFSQDSLTRHIPIHEAFFTISHRSKVLNFFLFLYFRGSVQSPDPKTADYYYYYYIIIIIIIIIINILFEIGKIYKAPEKN